MANDTRVEALRHLETVLSSGALGSLSDKALLDRFLSGSGNSDSAAAFAALVERHGPMVLGVCRDVLREVHDAEDASQATFLILAKRGRSIRRPDSLASWLFGVALRVAAKARLETARRREIERRGGEMKSRLGDHEVRAVSGPEIYAELDRLPEKFRAPIILCHLEGLTNEQAAVQLGFPVRTIQRRLAQGRDRLRARLGRHGIDRATGFVGLWCAANAAPEAWLEATVRAAAGLAAGQKTAAVASTAVTALTEGVLTIIFINRLKIAAASVMAAGALIVAMVGTGAAIASRNQTESSTQKDEIARVASDQDAQKAGSPAFARVGPWIKGVVVDTSGRTVAGAQVSSLWTVDSKVVTTKTDGTFVIATNEPRLLNQSFLATADDGARQGTFRFDGPTGFKDPRSLVRIVLKPACIVAVSVVDARGAPVEGAVVEVLDLVFPVAKGRTDARGIVKLSAPSDALTYWIYGYKPGVGFDYFENYASVPPLFSPPPERAWLVLNGTRTVRVRALDSADQPVPGVEIMPITVLKKGKLKSVNFSGSFAKVRTDAQGIATFDWLPSDIQAGTAFVAATLSYCTPKWPILDVDKPNEVVTMRLLRHTTISGKVTRPDGAPASEILVVAQGAGNAYPAGSGSARTLADGSYTLAVPPEQSYMVYVDDGEWAARTQTGVVVREGQPRSGVDLRLENGSVISGRVTAGGELASQARRRRRPGAGMMGGGITVSPGLASKGRRRGQAAGAIGDAVNGGQGSEPASGLAVMLVEQGPSVPKGTLKDQPENLSQTCLRIADTDADGRYAFRVGPGDYQLTGPSESGTNVIPQQIRIGDATDIVRDFHVRRLRRPWQTLRGVVHLSEPGGPPVAAAIVVAQPIGARVPPSHGFADDDGRFELFCPSETALVYARDPRGNFAGCAILAAADDSEVGVVARPAAMARGRVVDSSGKPRAGVQVHYAVMLELEDAGGPAGAGQSVETDDQGRFNAPGLIIGARCKIFATGTAGGNSPSHEFEVKDTRPIDIGDIVLGPG
jgi:RNA polymerase sigma factor (sigma-70 family)